MHKYFYLTAIASTLLLSTTTFSSPLAMNSQSCQMVRGHNKPFILVLKKGENIHKSILKCAQDARLHSASFSGLGAMEYATLRYFNHESKKYEDKQFGKNLEIISLPGNITKLDDKYFAHIHVSLGDANYHVIGGHLKEGIVGATTEITVTPLKENLYRVMNEEVGITLIKTPALNNLE